MRRITSARDVLSLLFSVLLLCAVVVITCTPFVLMISGSFKEDYEIFSMAPSLLPRQLDLRKYQQLFANWPFLRSMLNSVYVTSVRTIGACFFCTMAGFAFAKYKFPGKNTLFIIMLATMMLPSETSLVPSYVLFRALGGVNQMWSLIVTGLVPAFGVFMLRQFAAGGLPDDTIESARIEGANEHQILMRIGFPMLAPAIFSFAILHFMNSWNDFLWPIIIMTERTKLTSTALLRSIADASSQGNNGVLLAATTISVIPILLIYAIFHRQIVTGVLEGTGKEG